ncbi:MAG: hemin uptake protein HemP [Hyphomicrobiales bacterium]|jgi:hemin uptake protein HemP|nr:MAG: hemin uptake protein HemP [Hyphomicrobiales bacterium]
MPDSDLRSTDNPVKVVKSDEILGGGNEIQIEHNGMIYRLRVTRQDKLILTK